MEVNTGKYIPFPWIQSGVGNPYDTVSHANLDDFSNLQHLGFPSLDLLFFHVFSNPITKNHESLDTVAKGMSIPGISIVPKGKGSTHTTVKRVGSWILSIQTFDKLYRTRDNLDST